VSGPHRLGRRKSSRPPQPVPNPFRDEAPAEALVQSWTSGQVEGAVGRGVGDGTRTQARAGSVDRGRRGRSRQRLQGGPNFFVGKIAPNCPASRRSRKPQLCSSAGPGRPVQGPPGDRTTVSPRTGGCRWRSAPEPIPPWRPGYGSAGFAPGQRARSRPEDDTSKRQGALGAGGGTNRSRPGVVSPATTERSRGCSAPAGAPGPSLGWRQARFGGGFCVCLPTFFFCPPNSRRLGVGTPRPLIVQSVPRLASSSSLRSSSLPSHPPNQNEGYRSRRGGTEMNMNFVCRRGFTIRRVRRPAWPSHGGP